MCGAFYFVFVSCMSVLLLTVVLPSMLILTESSCAGALDSRFEAIERVNKQLFSINSDI